MSALQGWRPYPATLATSSTVSRPSAAARGPAPLPVIRHPLVASAPVRPCVHNDPLRHRERAIAVKQGAGIDVCARQGQVIPHKRAIGRLAAAEASVMGLERAVVMGGLQVFVEYFLTQQCIVFLAKL